ncbi:MAG TPA: CheR family methyltransferase, partial [Pirellulales bacterium]|nr:CheR family methyltransferase [Pirellulales bacterium]
VRRGQNWSVQESFRRGVSFAYHNLVHHAFPPPICGVAPFDLVLCRNVMIYFDPAIVRRLIGQFYDCLAEGGWLAVGPTEPSVGLFRSFQVVNSPGAVLYRKAPRRSAGSGPTIHCSGVPTREDRRSAGAVATPTVKKSAAASVKSRRPKRSARRPLAEGDGALPEGDVALPTLALARAQLDRGDTQGALTSCQRLIKADRLNPLAHFYHAVAAGQQGFRQETERSLRRAIYLDRDFVLAHYHLGLLLKRESETRAARRSFRNVLAILERRDAGEVFADADGLTVGALRQLTDLHLGTLDRP